MSESDSESDSEELRLRRPGWVRRARIATVGIRGYFLERAPAHEVVDSQTCLIDEPLSETDPDALGLVHESLQLGVRVRRVYAQMLTPLAYLSDVDNMS